MNDITLLINIVKYVILLYIYVCIIANNFVSNIFVLKNSMIYSTII